MLFATRRSWPEPLFQVVAAKRSSTGSPRASRTSRMSEAGSARRFGNNGSHAPNTADDCSQPHSTTASAVAALLNPFFTSVSPLQLIVAGQRNPIVTIAGRQAPSIVEWVPLAIDFGPRPPRCRYTGEPHT